MDNLTLWGIIIHILPFLLRVTREDQYHSHVCLLNAVSLA